MAAAAAAKNVGVGHFPLFPDLPDVTTVWRKDAPPCVCLHAQVAVSFNTVPSSVNLEIGVSMRNALTEPMIPLLEIQ